MPGPPDPDITNSVPSKARLLPVAAVELPEPAWITLMHSRKENDLFCQHNFEDFPIFHVPRI
jgi:hypothetical protein